MYDGLKAESKLVLISKMLRLEMLTVFTDRTNIDKEKQAKTRSTMANSAEEQSICAYVI